jgi:hypothetical protein
VQDRLQRQRFELKYRIHADAALHMREFVSCYLVLDEFSAGRPNNSYANHSIYLDSEDFCTYWDVVNSNRNRYKLRMRFYDDNPATPVFFEFKRRENDAILKQRAAVRRDAVPVILAGQLPEVSHLFSNVPKHLTALQHFSRIMLDIQATPKVHVAYLREAWVSQADNSVRVTFDRHVRAARHLTDDISTKMENSSAAFEPDVILELKFTGRFPLWFGELVRVFGVRQCGAAKYADHVAVLGQQNIARGYSPFAEEDAIERMLRRHAVTLGAALSIPREGSQSTAGSPIPASKASSSDQPPAPSSS